MVSFRRVRYIFLSRAENFVLLFLIQALKSLFIFFPNDLYLNILSLLNWRCNNVNHIIYQCRRECDERHFCLLDGGADDEELGTSQGNSNSLKHVTGKLVMIYNNHYMACNRNNLCQWTIPAIMVILVHFLFHS